MQLKGDKWSLKARDFLRGAILAIGTPVIFLIQSMIPGWNFTWMFTWVSYFTKNAQSAVDCGKIFELALSAFVAYIVRQWPTDTLKQAEKRIDLAKKEAREEQIKIIRDNAKV